MNGQSVQSLRAMVKQTCDSAHQGDAVALAEVWDRAEEFVQTLHDIAMARPDRLKSIAPHMLFFPSLRAKAKMFTHDFDVIADAIGLSHDCVVRTDKATLQQLDSPATRMIAKRLEFVARMRLCIGEVRRGYRAGPVKRIIVKGEAHSVSEKRFMSSVFDAETLSYQRLPPFSRRTLDRWWKEAIEPFLEKPETLDQLQLSDTKFFDELTRASKSSNRSDRKGKGKTVLDVLKHRCRSALKGLAKPK